MKIVYTKHATKKFTDLAELGVIVSKSLISKILHHPLSVDSVSDHPNKIAVGSLDPTHVLRIVYREENDIITVITFYPASKDRYI